MPTEKHANRLMAPPVPMPPWIWSGIAQWTGLADLERAYGSLPATRDAAQFTELALARLGVDYRIEAADLRRVPATGPVVVTANHPLGGLDGLVAIAALLRRRPDLRVMSNATLARIPQIAPLLVPVDNFHGPGSVAANARALRAALREVQRGGALLLFPAGAVAHLQVRAGCVVDPPWPEGLLGLLRRIDTPVVPAWLSGANSVAFQLAGLVHPALRTALLPRELANKAGLSVTLRLGAPLRAQRVATLAREGRLGQHLRIHTYALAADRPRGTAVAAPTDGPAPASAPAEVIAPTDPRALLDELRALGPARRLAAATHLEAYCARAEQIPSILREIGRLREITFRGVGEGTGKAMDLDAYDPYYEHLFVWDPRQHLVVGAYRLGRIDAIRRHRGRGSLYIESLFELRDPFLALLGPALELGRSFVRPEYQRSFAPLLALWRGIGEYVGRDPRYARLIGPVSVSAEYDRVSRELLVRFARRHHFDGLLGSLVRPRLPFRSVPALQTLGREIAGLGLESLSELLAEREPDGKGVPVLLRQYLKLGGRFLGFNVDPLFGHCVDFLTYVDLRRAPHAALARYMSPASLQRFRLVQGTRAAAAA